MTLSSAIMAVLIAFTHLKQSPLSLMKSDLLQDLRFTKSIVKIAMDVWWNSKRKSSVYKIGERKKKDYYIYIYIYTVMNLSFYTHSFLF